MKVTNIDILPIDTDMHPEKQRIRKQAPKYIKSIIEDTYSVDDISSIEQLRPEHIDALGGGVDAATYLVHTPKVQIIIKMAYDGLDAEAEALRSWRKKHAHVPDILATGIVPATRRQKKPVKYLVQSAMLNKNGRVVETCASYLAHYPKQSRSIGRLLGAELKKIHSAIADRSFGEFADSPGNTAAYGNWNGYVMGFFNAQSDYLKRLRISDEQISGVQNFIRQNKFIRRGRYLHGDFSIRNTALKSYDPLQVALFDPNPVIGDPTWDIAVLFNNYEFQKRRQKIGEEQEDLLLRDRQLLTGFKQSYDRRIDQNSLVISQLIQALLQAQYKENSEQTDDNRIDTKVRKEFIIELIGSINRRPS